MDSVGYMTCALKIETQSPGWHKTFTKVLKSIQGLSFTIDAERGICRVSGKIDPHKLLMKLAKAGKHADLIWVDSGAESLGNNLQKLHQNSYGHGNGGYGYGYGYSYPSGYDYMYNNPSYYNYMNPPLPSYVPPEYHGLPQYYDPYCEPLPPPARYFPQGPPPPQNPRLESLCNMM